MCGLAGIWSNNKIDDSDIKHLNDAVLSMKHRGPDNITCKSYSNLALGHARLSIIDLNANANQPFTDQSGHYHLAFNGEIYNYKDLKRDLEQKGVRFKTNSDTEVLLYHLIENGVKGLRDLNGFFAIAFYDSVNDQLLLARDRMGIKPLLYSQKKNQLVFASELQALLSLGVEKLLDKKALNQYFALTYIPAPRTIFESVKKLLPGEYLISKESGLTTGFFCDQKNIKSSLDYETAKKDLESKLQTAVSSRLVSDVPLGSFLSGGLDSSIIAALAKEMKGDINTFSIGFDHQFFDESGYAEEVANHIGSKHHNFILTKNDFKNNFGRFLDSIDEPFADSSAFAVFLLSEKTKEKVTVSLSGDGADELFGGYRKHFGEWKIRNISSFKKAMIKGGAGVLGKNESRSDKLGDFNRKLQKLSKGLKLNDKERYQFFASFISKEDRTSLLNDYRSEALEELNEEDIKNVNDFLLNDQRIILPNDMLKKVDSMSMAHSLEVRTPFLDVDVVDFANSLPVDFKLNKNGGKRILKDTFASRLPSSVINRSKKGFEIPIKDWLDNEIKEYLNQEIFSKEYIEHQGLFNYEFIEQLKRSWKSPAFGDRIYVVWALILFQSWWKRHLD